MQDVERARGNDLYLLSGFLRIALREPLFSCLAY